MTIIQWAAFQNCTGLTSVTIPQSITYIGNGVFQGCFRIVSIFSYLDEPFAINKKSTVYRTFDLDIYNNATLYVPKGTIFKYQTTEGWQDFANIVEMVDGTTDIENINIETITDNRYFNLNGQRIESQPSQKGVYIKNGKKVLMK